ncbi:MAG: MerC domain-containing protein [Planctomycetota bacterium]
MSNNAALEVTPRFWDRLGVWASVACAVHCLAAPLIFLALPAVAGIWAHPGSHALMALLVVPLAIAALGSGFRVHRKAWVLAIAAAGIGCILVSCALPFVAAQEEAAVEAGAEGEAEAACASCCPQIVPDETGEVGVRWPPASIAAMVGSGLLVAGHLGNLACRRCCRPGDGCSGAG